MTLVGWYCVGLAAMCVVGFADILWSDRPSVTGDDGDHLTDE